MLCVPFHSTGFRRCYRRMGLSRRRLASCTKTLSDPWSALGSALVVVVVVGVRRGGALALPVSCRAESADCDPPRWNSPLEGRCAAWSASWSVACRVRRAGSCFRVRSFAGSHFGKGMSLTPFRVSDRFGTGRELDLLGRSGWSGSCAGVTMGHHSCGVPRTLPAIEFVVVWLASQR